MLKLQISLASEVLPRLCHLDHHDILNSNSPSPIRIISWFIGNDHALCERDFVQRETRSDALRTFVDIEEVADSVSCAVTRYILSKYG